MLINGKKKKKKAEIFFFFVNKVKMFKNEEKVEKMNKQ